MLIFSKKSLKLEFKYEVLSYMKAHHCSQCFGSPELQPHVTVTASSWQEYMNQHTKQNHFVNL